MTYPSRIAFLLLLFVSPFAAASPPAQHMKSESLPSPPFDPKGGFMALINNTLLAAGVNGGRMVLWKCVLDGGNAWQPTEVQVPREAATARHGNSWIVIGGIENGVPSANVCKIELQSGVPHLKELPRLPLGLAGVSAAVIADKLYVFGGNSHINPPEPTSSLWMLDLKNPHQWLNSPAFPGEARAFAASTEQYGMFCVFGGNGASGTLKDCWIFRPKPIEGTNQSGWKRAGDMPVEIQGAMALPLGQAQVLLLGAEHPLLFHTLTHAWCAFDVLVDIKHPQGVRTGSKTLVIGSQTDGKPAALELSTPRSARNLQWIDWGVIGGYFLILSGIGFYFSRKQDSSAEFSLGNRKVKWWAAGISMFATGASAISFMAIPALAFATNLVWLFPLVALIPAYFATAHLIYPLLRRMEITSTYEYLERRFNRILRVIASVQCIVFQTFARAAVVLVLPSLAISSMTGMNVYASVLIMGVVTTIYTAIGGFDAVIWTEVFQGILKFFAPLIMIGICVAALPGGFGEFLQVGHDFGKFEFAITTWDINVPAFWVLMLGTFLTVTVSSAGDQPIIQRVFSAPLKEVRRVNATFTVCGILIGIISNVVGLAIFAYFRAHPDKFEPLAQNDQVVPMFVAQALPPGMAGMVVAAIFASAMATVASAMNSVATIFTEDFYMKLRPGASDGERLRTLKAVSYIVGAIGTAMALVLAAQDLKSMMVVWNQMVALIGGGIVGVYSLGMFTKRANGFGAICGALASVLITSSVKLYTNVHWAAYIPIAILSCIVIGYIASLFRPAAQNLAGLTVHTPAAPSTGAANMQSAK